MIVVGDVQPDAVRANVERLLGRWRPGVVPAVSYGELPTRTARDVIVVDRPESAQSVIVIGNAAVTRASVDYLPLVVANQVLGGSAAARLFMDLRERRSLTYGAYSTITDTVGTGAFRASASVRNDVTGEAVEAFFEHLVRIRTERVPAAELTDAHRYLSDSFPLRRYARKIAGLISDLRIFGLPDDYWDRYRTAVARSRQSRRSTPPRGSSTPIMPS